MKIAFTVCSNSYWAQAKILFQSLANTNPDYTLILGLVDKKNDTIDYTVKNGKVSVVEISQLNIPEEYNVFKKYIIIELCTSVKAAYIKWIKKNYPEAEIVLYFDPDIKVFSSLSEIESELKNKSILLTPHVYKPVPIDNNLIPNESLFLNYGIYNLGFIGVSFHDQEIYDFLDWWDERLMKQCFMDAANGIYVDQLPLNFVPVFYPQLTKIIFHYGMNVAPWNLHERHISLRDGEYYANEDKLVFFHFSYFRLANEKHPFYNRYEVYPVLEELHAVYDEELKESQFTKIKTIPNGYKLKPYRPLWKQIRDGVTPPLFYKILSYIHI